MRSTTTRGGKPYPLGPACVTLDVNLDMELSASNGFYETLGQTLDGLGFESTNEGLVPEFDRLPVANDYLVGGTKDGGRTVDDIQASTFPGILKKLEFEVFNSVQGTNDYGVQVDLQVPTVSIGPLLVMKRKAFFHRLQPKDAYHLMTLSLLHAWTAPQEFAKVGPEGNPGFALAKECLGNSSNRRTVRVRGML